MEATALALKTEKGQEEIRSRAHGLSQKLRTLLIMVDGKSTVGDLLARFPGVAEIEANLPPARGTGLRRFAPSEVPRRASPLRPPRGCRSRIGGNPTREQALSALTRMLIEADGSGRRPRDRRHREARTRAEFDKAAVVRCMTMLEGHGGRARRPRSAIGHASSRNVS